MGSSQPVVMFKPIYFICTYKYCTVSIVSILKMCYVHIDKYIYIYNTVTSIYIYTHIFYHECTIICGWGQRSSKPWAAGHLR